MKIQSLQQFAEELIKGGFLLETRPIKSGRRGRLLLVEVGDTSKIECDPPVNENSVSYYLETIRQAKFSWLLFDGSLIQISYLLRGNDVEGHRFCYVPAPFLLDLRNDPEGLDEIIESGSVSNPLDQVRRALLRFEYDPAAQTPTHPAAHIHLNAPDCRIPMRSPLSVREFVFFLLHFFYSEQFDAHALASPRFGGVSTLSGDEERAFHVNWRLTEPEPAH